MKITLISMGVFIALLALYFVPVGSPPKEAQQKSAYKTKEVLKGELTVRISAKGAVEPNFKVEVKSKASGEILKFSFEEGDHLKKGTLLLQLDKSDELRNVGKAKADQASSIAKFKKAKTAWVLQKTRYKTDLKKARSAVEAAEVNLKESRDKFKRQVDLFEKKFAAQESLDAAETLYKVNQEKLIQARAQLQAAKDSIHDITIKANEVELARADVQLSKIALDEAQERLEETEIFAPITGVMIQKMVEEGQIIASGISNVSGGTALATLADVSRLFIMADVDETDIGVVQVGQAVAVTADAFIGKTFQGKVTRIAPQGAVENSITIFKVKIEILGPGKDILKPQMSANIDIITGNVVDSVYVAREAVHKEGDEVFAMILEEGVPQKVRVTTGIKNPIFIQILSGLEPGQKVLVGNWKKIMAEAEQAKGMSTVSRILWMLRSK